MAIYRKQAGAEVTVTLTTEDGSFVTLLRVPDFRPHIEGILWGARFFYVDPVEPDTYIEGVLWQHMLQSATDEVYSIEE